MGEELVSGCFMEASVSKSRKPGEGFRMFQGQRFHHT